MNMFELIAWFIGITLAIWGIGLGLLFQGGYLLEKDGDKRSRWAERMWKWGIIWLCIGGIFLAFIIYLLFFVME